MRRVAVRGAAFGLAIFWLAVPAAEGTEQRKRWWHDEEMKAELQLSEQQSTEVELVFQSALPRLRTAKKQLDLLEEDLSKMIRERTAEESQVAQLVDRVEAARSALSKERTLMLYRIHRILTPEQNVRLKELHARQERERGRRDPKP